MFAEMAHSAFKHVRAVHAGALRGGAGTEQCADVTQMRRGEQRVDERMDGDITVGVPS